MLAELSGLISFPKLYPHCAIWVLNLATTDSPWDFTPGSLSVGASHMLSSSTDYWSPRLLQELSFHTPPNVAAATIPLKMGDLALDCFDLVWHGFDGKNLEELPSAYTPATSICVVLKHWRVNMEGLPLAGRWDIAWGRGRIPFLCRHSVSYMPWQEHGL